MLTNATLGLALALSLAAALVSVPAVRAELHAPAVVRISELPPPGPAPVATPELTVGFAWPLP